MNASQKSLAQKRVAQKRVAQKDVAQKDVDQLIAAGAVLPAEGVGPGGDRDTISARSYTHPALDDRVVVRLVPEVLGRAEDLTLEFLGFTEPERATAVGVGRRSALGFPAWALIHDPANAHHALNLVKNVEKLTRTARSKAGSAKDGFLELGAMLGRSAPHFLPTFYEQAGRAFLQHGNVAYAATMFGKAREAEEVHDLVVDPERLREVFLEFAFAGALTAKALSSHAKGLAKKQSTDEAYASFFTLCVERTRGGLPPYTGMPEDLRRLARAAKRDLAAEDEALLRVVLDTSAISMAGAGFWKSYRSSLVSLASRDAAVRGQLLGFVPESNTAHELWLEVLAECGATAALTAPAGTVAPEAEAPAGPAGWLGAMIAARNSGWRSTARSAALLDLVAAMADRLRADGVPVAAVPRWRCDELDLLDLCCAEGVPLAMPERAVQLPVEAWLRDDAPGRRDLAALAADERFVAPLGTGLIGHLRRASTTSRVPASLLRPLLGVPGLRTALRAWVVRSAADLGATGLPGLQWHLDDLEIVHLPEAYADSPETAGKIAATDVAAVLRATLRGGLLDEYGWPALEAALEALNEGSEVKPGEQQPVRIAGEGWPALVLRRGESVVVVGPDGVLAEHVLRIPAELRHDWVFEPYASWHDGVLLVRWRGPDGDLAYWSDAPEQVFDPGEGAGQRRSGPSASLALPGGGRFAGRRAVHPGDTELPARGPAFGDGTHFWTAAYHDGAWRWFELDPATGTVGRASVPAFVEDFAVDGARLDLLACDVRPSHPATAASPLGESGGLHGWRVRRESDGRWHGERVDGVRVVLPSTAPRPHGALSVPGGDGVLVVSDDEHDRTTLFDEHGVRRAVLTHGANRQVMARGTALVPPLAWWHLLRPRDEAGSRALRAISRDAVEQLLAAAVAEAADDGARQKPKRRLAQVFGRGATDDPAAVLKRVAPEITHPELVAGVLGVVRCAAALSRRFTDHARLADAATAVDTSLFAETGPTIGASVMRRALTWFSAGRDSSSAAEAETVLPALVAELGARVATIASGGAPATSELPQGADDQWEDHLVFPRALLWRAASPITPHEEREALLVFLRAVAESGMTSGGGHWRTVTVLAPDNAVPPNRTVAVPGGFLHVVSRGWSREALRPYRGLQYSAVPGSFSLPPTWRLDAARPCAEDLDPATAAAFSAALAANGPLEWRPEWATALVERTGLGLAEATLLLSGLPHVDGWASQYLSTSERTVLGLSSAAAKAARERFKSLGHAERRALLHAAVPRDPAGLWTSGPDLDGLADAWTARFGRRQPVPDELLVEAAKVLPVRDSAEYVSGIANPATCTWLTTDAHPRTAAGARETSTAFTATRLLAVPQVLLWLAHRLPVGSPLRAQLPEALALASQRVAHEDFLIDFGSLHQDDPLFSLIDVPRPALGTSATFAGWLEMTTHHELYSRLHVRPSAVGPEHRDLLVALSGNGYGGQHLAALDLLSSPGLAAACAVPAPPGADPASFHQHPAVSAPELLAEVAARLDLDADAAALYLMLLALPDPTDANTARWTGWKPAQLRAARTALAGTDLVLTAKRARAGRSLFLPGGWLPLKAPHLPIESWKAPMFGFTTTPHRVVVPLEPVADLFQRAWQRVLDGDAPAYEQLETGGRR
ncbi:hypothetical protein [Umezawaea beigongshangensis]|uniref:hypothetical protein n=1 Tax=Umezawaea beigongshangensis TaxID=2780383 RepID=UPI0027DD63D4|nr:hypothetical protein [Umezawaea beigongshangensis]